MDSVVLNWAEKLEFDPDWIEKIVEFFDDSEQMDKAFDWGLRWTAGRKD